MVLLGKIVLMSNRNMIVRKKGKIKANLRKMIMIMIIIYWIKVKKVMKT